MQFKTTYLCKIYWTYDAVRGFKMFPKGGKSRRVMPKWAAASIMLSMRRHLGLTKKISMWTNMLATGFVGVLVCFCCFHETSGIPEPPRPLSKHSHTHTHVNNEVSCLSHTPGPPFMPHPFTSSSKSISCAVTLQLYTLFHSLSHTHTHTVSRWRSGHGAERWDFYWE